MANTNIELKDGTKITIEGTAEEVARILQLYQSHTTNTEMNKQGAAKSKNGVRKRASNGATDRLRLLYQEGFFDKPKTAGEVKEALVQKGHHHALKEISARLLDLTKASEIRRLKQDGKWCYVKV